MHGGRKFTPGSQFFANFGSVLGSVLGPKLARIPGHQSGSVILMVWTDLSFGVLRRAVESENSKSLLVHIRCGTHSITAEGNSRRDRDFRKNLIRARTGAREASEPPIFENSVAPPIARENSLRNHVSSGKFRKWLRFCSELQQQAREEVLLG